MAAVPSPSGTSAHSSRWAKDREPTPSQVTSTFANCSTLKGRLRLALSNLT